MKNDDSLQHQSTARHRKSQLRDSSIYGLLALLIEQSTGSGGVLWLACSASKASEFFVSSVCCNGIRTHPHKASIFENALCICVFSTCSYGIGKRAWRQPD